MTDDTTRQYTARITVIDADPSVELGMTARVRVANARAEAAYRLPLTALYQAGGESFVWVVSPEQSQVHRRQVQIGDLVQNAVIVAGGLERGETVVTAGVHLLFEGQKVRSVGGA